MEWGFSVSAFDPGGPDYYSYSSSYYYILLLLLFLFLLYYYYYYYYYNLYYYSHFYYEYYYYSSSGAWQNAWDVRCEVYGLYQDPPCTLNWGYMVPNSGYLGPYRG